MKWICGFANAQGGKIYISIDDKSEVTGLDDYKKLMEDLPNKIVNYLGIYVESWGRGIEIMVEGCRQYGIPDPIIEEETGGISVTFLKDIYTEEYLQTLNINDRQVKVILYIKEYGRITNKIYQKINNISKPGATLDLQELTNRDLIIKTGTTGRGTYYTLNKKGLIKG